MSDKIICLCCGKTPSYECRIHFINDINKLKEALESAKNDINNICRQFPMDIDLEIEMDHLLCKISKELNQIN